MTWKPKWDNLKFRRRLAFGMLFIGSPFMVLLVAMPLWYLTKNDTLVTAIMIAALLSVGVTGIYLGCYRCPNCGRLFHDGMYPSPIKTACGHCGTVVGAEPAETKAED